MPWKLGFRVKTERLFAYAIGLKRTRLRIEIFGACRGYSITKLTQNLSLFKQNLNRTGSLKPFKGLIYNQQDSFAAIMNKKG